MSRTRGELSRLQDEEAQLEQSLLSGRVQLDSIVKSLKTTQEEINQVGAQDAGAICSERVTYKGPVCWNPEIFVEAKKKII